jgi:hypothetical protein
MTCHKNCYFVLVKLILDLRARGRMLKSSEDIEATNENCELKLEKYEKLV